MDTVNEFELKRRKYMPVFPKTRGKPTIYIPGYPYEDEEPMPASAWEEGVPAVVFEFLSDSTANQDRTEKVHLYLIDMGVEEYFIHQPEMEKPPEFRGWRRSR